MKRNLLLAVVAFFASTAAVAALPPEQEQFWAALRALCGKAFAGKVVEGTAASDAQFAQQELVMHVRACGKDEIRIPFHVGANRSRTWVITRTATGLRLKHDHRHEDGAEDKITHYGGDTDSAGSAKRQDFPADPHTAALIPAAKTNVWSISVDEKTFAYGLRREAEGRRFRVEFDLTRPVAAPPPPWGSR
jgi:opacity protein-like surface antigen